MYACKTPKAAGCQPFPINDAWAGACRNPFGLNICTSAKAFSETTLSYEKQSTCTCKQFIESQNSLSWKGP